MDRGGRWQAQASFLGYMDAFLGADADLAFRRAARALRCARSSSAVLSTWAIEANQGNEEVDMLLHLPIAILATLFTHRRLQLRAAVRYCQRMPV